MIVIISRDHIATLLLYRCLRYSHTEHELRTIFSSSQLSQKRSKLLDCTFWKFFYKRNFFFLIHLLYAKTTFNSDRRLYKKRWCDLTRTWSFNFHWNSIHYWVFTDHCRETHWLLSQNDARSFHELVSRNDSNSFHKLMSRDDSDNFHKLVSSSTLIKIYRETLYSIFNAARNWTNSFLINNLMRSSIII